MATDRLHFIFPSFTARTLLIAAAVEASAKDTEQDTGAAEAAAQPTTGQADLIGSAIAATELSRGRRRVPHDHHPQLIRPSCITPIGAHCGRRGGRREGH